MGWGDTFKNKEELRTRLKIKGLWLKKQKYSIFSTSGLNTFLTEVPDGCSKTKKTVREVEVMAQTMAEHLIEQGIERGKAQGIEQGIKQGETQAKQEVILKMIRLRFDSVPESVTSQITRIRSLSRLDALVENVLTAQTLDEIDLQNHDG